jgi:hypothetical protein
MKLINRYKIVVCLPLILTLPAALPAAGTDSWAKDEATVADINEKCGKGTLDFFGLMTKGKGSLGSARNDLPAQFLMAYFACMGSMPNPKWDCSFFQNLDGHANYISECNQFKLFNILLSKVFQSEDAAPACQKLMDNSGFIPGKDIPRFCAIFIPALKTSRTNEFCAKIKAAGISFTRGHSCPADFAFLSGPEACDPKHDCYGDTSFLEILRASNPQKACAAFPMCSAITARNPHACASYLDLAKKDFCKKVASRASKNNADKEAIRRATAAESARIAREAQEKARKAQAVVDPETKALREKAAQEVAAAKEAARKKSEAEISMSKRVAEERQKRREAQRKKVEPPLQMQKGQRLQAIPPEVKKRLDELNKQGQAAQPADAGNP